METKTPLSGSKLIEHYLDTMINSIEPESEDFLTVLAEVTTDLQFIPIWLVFQPKSKKMESEFITQFQNYQEDVKNTPIRIDDDHELTAVQYKDALYDFMTQHASDQDTQDPLLRATYDFVAASYQCLKKIVEGSITREDQVHEAIMQCSWVKAHLEAKTGAHFKAALFQKACDELLQNKLNDFQEYVVKQDLEYLEEENKNA